MKSYEVKRFATLYEQHLNLLKIQGKIKALLMLISVLFAGLKAITIATLIV